MPENKGFYQKYNVSRVDGKPVGRTFTLELDRDPFAGPALEAYADAAEASGEFPELVKDLREIIQDVPPLRGMV